MTDSTDNARGPELKPCPFCGSSNIEADNNAHNPFYICKECNAYGPNGLASWNRRADLAPDPLQAVRVKPLAWVLEPDRPDDYPAWSADGCGKEYRVFKGWCGARSRWEYIWDVFYETEDAAKAAAQANYDQRIRSALEPDPQDARVAALVEAAKHCRELLKTHDIDRIDGEDLAGAAITIIDAALAAFDKGGKDE